MVSRFLRLVATSALAVTFVSVKPAPVPTPSCQGNDVFSSGCSIGSEQESGGDSGNNGGDSGDDANADTGSGNDNDNTPSTTGPTPLPGKGPQLGQAPSPTASVYVEGFCKGDICRDGMWFGPGTPQPSDPGTPRVTVRDIAEFTPKAPTAQMQPKVWMLRDAPTNFVASSGRHVVSATLLGRSADIRFTPAGFRFDYGDGSEPRTTTTGEARWEDAGLREFSETATSHVYEKRGTYTATVTALYSAEYRIDGGEWAPIDGTVGSPTTITGRTVTIDTVLVPGTCDEYPDGPGCPGWEPPPEEDE